MKKCWCLLLSAVCLIIMIITVRNSKGEYKTFTNTQKVECEADLTRLLERGGTAIMQGELESDSTFAAQETVTMNRVRKNKYPTWFRVIPLFSLVYQQAEDSCWKEEKAEWLVGKLSFEGIALKGRRQWVFRKPVREERLSEQQKRVVYGVEAGQCVIKATAKNGALTACTIYETNSLDTLESWITPIEIKIMLGLMILSACLTAANFAEFKRSK